MSFNLTRKTDYALIALSRLAKEQNGEGGPLSARQIADEYNLPLPLLMNALKELHRAGVLCSRRGAGGGYLLCDEPGRISLQRIIEALEGPVTVTLCGDDNHEDLDEPCQFMSLCPISEPITRFNGLLKNFLDSITLEDLIRDQALRTAELGVEV